MKSNILKQMTLRNFKGRKLITIDFSSVETIIKGDNEAGKSTIVDAWNWLISGKSAEFKQDFDVKTKTANGDYIHKLEHEVSAIINILGHDRSFKRVMKEKWTKKRGSEEEEFTGHETTYFIDEVPYNQTQFLREIEINFISDKVAIMLSNTSYFNRLKWDEQRAILTDISPDMSQEEIFLAMSESCSQNQIDNLKSNLTVNKDIDMYLAEIKSKQSMTNKELSSIPVRIDEVDRATKSDVNFEEIESKLKVEESKLVSIENEIKQEKDNEVLVQDQLNKAYTEKSNEKFEKEQKYQSLVRNANSIFTQNISNLETQWNSKKQKSLNITNDLNNKKNRAPELAKLIEQCEKQIAEFTAEWKSVNSSVVDFNTKTDCPTCSRPYDLANIEEQKKQAESKFNIEKVSKLQSITEKGTAKRTQLEEYQKEQKVNDGLILDLTIEINNLDKELKELQSEIDAERVKMNNSELPKEAIELKTELDAFVLPSRELGQNEKINALKLQKLELEPIVSKLKSELSGRDSVLANIERLKELKEQQKTLNSTLMQYEGIIFVIAKYKEIYINHIEQNVNNMFKYVKFKLFEEQVNGAVVPTCKCTVDGVDYSDVNTAGKINAGLDIIVTLQNHYGLQLPVFIDNKESVTELVVKPSQMICLEVKKGQKELEIELR